MNEDTLIDLIKSTVHFTKITAKGVHSVQCKVCGDTKTRAGFFFDSDHIGYHCFRSSCPIGSTKWYFDQHLPRRFKQVMEAFGVQIPSELLVSRRKPTAMEELETRLYEAPVLPVVQYPEEFVQYDPAKHPTFRNYLAAREVFDTDYMIGRGDNDYDGMLVIPMRLNGRLVAYQGIDIKRKRFATSNGDILYTPTGYITDNCIIVEGVWDAKSIPNAVATLHNSVNKRQAYLLRDKNPILLPDRSGSSFLRIAKRYGWRVSVPDWDVKDADDARRKYGSLVMAKKIHDGICDSLVEAEVKYAMWKSK